MSTDPPWKRFLPLLWWALLIVILYISIGLATGSVGEKTCPDTVSGPEPGASKLTIRYFGNPYCVYCWIQDPIMRRLAERHQSVLRYEHYDNRYCTNLTKAYGIYAVPGFVFNITGGPTITHVGFLREIYLSRVICETTGSCDGGVAQSNAPEHANANAPGTASRSNNTLQRTMASSLTELGINSSLSTRSTIGGP